jgi:TRAM domain-containing protein
MPTQAPEIDGVTLINDFEGEPPRAGQIRRLRITEAHDYDVVGTLLPGGDAETRGVLVRPGDAETNLIQITA